MHPCNRREFIRAGTTLAALVALDLKSADLAIRPGIDSRIRGLMLGTALGDAFGGPVEFQPRDAVQRLSNPPKIWRDDEILDPAARDATIARLQLRAYRDLRPEPESYGQWNHHSEAGTITDDTRHKLILLHALRRAETSGRWPISEKDFAQAYLDWPKTPAVTASAGYIALAADWLEEYQYAARWVVGERNLVTARPPERLWGGIPTCAGQMAMLPLAALFAGKPESAYRATYSLAFIDNGWARDMIASLVAGLAVALVTEPDPKNPRRAWNAILQAVRTTDPFGYGSIRWTTRSVTRWIGVAETIARNANRRPARLFAALEKEFEFTTKWEAQVPFVVVFASLELADYDPLAALQLSMEWGHDTDSYAQLLGAFIGALHGPDLFKASWRERVTARLKADHRVDLEDDCRLLSRLQRLSLEQQLVR